MSGPVRVHDLLAATARRLVERLDADGCAISRSIGEALVLMAEYSVDGRPLTHGNGYLVSDFPLTLQVLAGGAPLTLSLLDADVDPAEGRVLQDLGYTALAMLSLRVGGEPWALVEVYRAAPRRFDADDVAAAVAILDEAASALGG